MKLVVVCLARDEADRFWRSALEAWNDFADQLLVMVDGTVNDDDLTPVLAINAGAKVTLSHNGADGSWGNESPARHRLWNFAMRNTKPQDWLLILDADMVPARDPRPLLEADADAIAFKLFDLWHEADGKLFYRDDNYWRGHLFPRVWAVRRPETPPEGWQWPDKGIHCGHFPQNLGFLKQPMIAPEDYSLLHYAYSQPKLRAQKRDQYLSVHEQLSDFELRHALSITDSLPELKELPFEPQYKLRLAA